MMGKFALVAILCASSLVSEGREAPSSQAPWPNAPASFPRVREGLCVIVKGSQEYVSEVYRPWVWAKGREPVCVQKA
jgi:hypothetical protein